MAARSPWWWSPAGSARWLAHSDGVGTRSSPSRTPAPTGTAAHAWTPSGGGDSGRAARCAGTTPSAPLRRGRAWRPPPPAPASVCPLTLKMTRTEREAAEHVGAPRLVPDQPWKQRLYPVFTGLRKFGLTFISFGEKKYCQIIVNLFRKIWIFLIRVAKIRVGWL